MSRRTRVMDVETGTVKEFNTMSEAADWLKGETGMNPNAASLSRVIKTKSLYAQKYRVERLDAPKPKRYVAPDSLCDRKGTKDGWYFWQGGLTPDVICMERVLPFYDQARFEIIREELAKFKCHVYFDITDDEYAAKKRTKCRIEIYRKIEKTPFKNKMDIMLEMFKKK